MYCMAGTLMSLSWMPAVVNSVVKTKGWLVITMSPGRIGEVLGKPAVFKNLPEPPLESRRKLLRRFVTNGLE